MANKTRKDGAQGNRLLKRRIVVVVPPVEELDLVGPVQVLSAADRLSEKKVYSIEIATSGKDLTVEGESGILSFLAQERLHDVKGKIDSVLLVCGVGTRLLRDAALSAWLRNISPAIRRLGGVCVASFLLAEAGLLNSKRATTHWKFGRELVKRYPKVCVESEPIWVKDGNIYT
ncbi:MAG: DJ-1/PfpI family protein [Blastocatellia bacterium]|nr:DJ-1/PfpI family protein [Blastocatellia bacterium]